MSKKRKAAALLALTLPSLACFAGGDAEWNEGVSSINKLRGQINSDSANLRKAGVDVNALNKKLSWAQSEMERIRLEMLRERMSSRQSSTLSNAVNQYELFKSGAAFSSNGTLRLKPVEPIIDMGMSNAFSANGSLVKCAPLYEVKPTFPFQPLRAPEEVLRDNASLAASPKVEAPLLALPPAAAASTAKASSASPGLGVIDPAVLKAGDPQARSLEIAAPPLPAAQPLPSRGPATTGDFDVISSNGTRISNGYNLLPPEPPGPDKVNVSVYGELDAAGSKTKLSAGTSGVELEKSKGEILQAAGGIHWDWDGKSSVFGKAGTSAEIPVSPDGWILTGGAGRTWSSAGEVSDSIEAGLAKGYKIPLAGAKKAGVSAGLNLSMEWNAKNASSNEGFSELYGPAVKAGK